MLCIYYLRYFRHIVKIGDFYCIFYCRVVYFSEWWQKLFLLRLRRLLVSISMSVHEFVWIFYIAT